MAFFEIFAGFVTFIFLFITYRKWCQTYWYRKNVPSIDPSLMWGNMENPITSKYGLKFDIKNAYDNFKKHGHKHGGIYLSGDPVWIPVDQGLIKNILVKDFAHFMGHGLEANPETDPLSANIFNLEGDEWKFIRSKLSPTFTSGKMKMMFSTLVDCSVPMLEHIDGFAGSDKLLDIKDILASFTTDVIGSCAFGIECNSFKDPNSEFVKYGQKVFEPTFDNKVKILLAFAAPFLRRIFSFRMVPLEIEQFYTRIVKSILDYRESKNVTRNDFMQLFLDINAKAKQTGEKGLTLEQVTAQAFVFFLGGFETSSSTMTLCLHELAFNQDIQDKLRAEIKETLRRNDGKLTYDNLMEMKYLDQVVNETLRKYPIVPFVMRSCNKDYKVPDSVVTIPEGMKLFISTLGIHRDSEYYADPDKFDPQRFSDENKNRIPQFAYIPFGEGPRICIGLRFGLMQTKTGLAVLLNKFKFTPKAGEKYDIHFDPRTFNLSKEGNVLLKAERL